MKTYIFCAIFLLIANHACKNRKDSDSTSNKEPTVLIKPQPGASPNKAPVINIVDTISPKRMVIYMKDSAANPASISTKLAQIYGVKLMEVLKTNGISSTGQPIAWYKTQKAPFFFEAGIPVNKKPLKLPKSVYFRELPADSVVIAHFYGPYELTPQAYTAVSEWMKDSKKRAKGSAYEIYVTDPLGKDGLPIDPYKVRTDIVFPRK